MNTEEIFVCTKVENERCCFKSVLRHDYIKNIQDLTKEEAKIAAAAKEGAIEILKDALKKKDKVLMKIPTKVVTKGEAKEPFWMKRHAILTEDLVKKLLVELKIVRFKKDIYKNNTFAYVKPRDETRTIYLCNLFWDAPKYLQENSQPGTLIHEVSHFLGTADIVYGNYENPTLQIGCKGDMVKDVHFRPASSSTASPVEEEVHDALWKAFWNADNVEYEFERTINHKGSYEGGKYSCCRETARYSVCDQSVPDFFLTCRVGERWEIEPLVKELCRRSRKIKDKLRDCQRIPKEVEEYPKKAETSRNVGLPVDVTRGRAADTGLLLAFDTFTISSSGEGYQGIAAGGAGAISKKKITTTAITKMNLLEGIFAECQHFLDDVSGAIASLNDKAGIRRDFGIQRTRGLINLMKEQVESERDDELKIHMYMGYMIQCDNLLESLCIMSK
ncbi:uncharacterized protein LOC103279011 [Anolis carolinensis]|uniref:uncharacterized protein LOC103279011 n=1 Tax=Anolis carolinensis TaxID=28377 RepID=UPI002F2B7771